MKINIPNVLASRYATPQMLEIWSAEKKIRLERIFWLELMKLEKAWGADIPDEAIEAYAEVVNNIDLDAIHAKELERRHDVIARLEVFNELAGYQYAHTPLTSRDLTDNIEQYQVYKSLELVRFRAAAVLARFKKKALEYQYLVMMGRSHNVAAQVITLGKRFANWAEEFLIGFRRIDQLLANYPARGIKGPMGTQQDLINYLKDPEAAISGEEG